jgi:hypothetical protein
VIDKYAVFNAQIDLLLKPQRLLKVVDTVLPLSEWRRTHMSKKFEDPFDGWGKLAERFCITFFMFLPSLLFMRVVLGWF